MPSEFHMHRFASRLLRHIYLQRIGVRDMCIVLILKPEQTENAKAGPSLKFGVSRLIFEQLGIRSMRV